MNRNETGQKNAEVRDNRSSENRSDISKKAPATAEEKRSHAHAGEKGNKAHANPQQNESGRQGIKDKNKEDNE